MVWAINGVVIALTYNWFLGPPTVTCGEAKSVLFFSRLFRGGNLFLPTLNKRDKSGGDFSSEGRRREFGIKKNAEAIDLP